MLADYTVPNDVNADMDFVPGATFRHAGGRVCCLELASRGKSGADAAAVTVLSGSAGGTVSAVQVELPLLAGSTLSDVRVRSYP